jgi:uncharacterized membrane protein
LVIAITLLVFYEYLYASLPFPNLINLIILIAASIISVYGAAYAVEEITKKRKNIVRYFAALIAILIISVVVYLILSGVVGPSRGNVDELAFNYYAAHLLLQGQNPYTTSMKLALSTYNITPTLLLNGTVLAKYIYPAFSMFPLLPVAAYFPIGSLEFFFSFIIFLTVISACIVYSKSGREAESLLPLTVWAFLTYAWLGTVIEYFAISVLLMLAYVYKDKKFLPGILIGLAASTTQLAWFAIPFLLVFIFRKRGKEALFRTAVTGFTVFLAVNGYYLLISPSTMAATLLVLSKTLVSGPNIMQLLVQFYPIPYAYSTMIEVLLFAFLVGTFYFYTDSFKPLLAVAPALLFLVVWRNSLTYVLPFMPYLILIYYEKEDKKIRDLILDKKPILYALGGLLIVSTAIILIGHSSYAGTNTLKITQAVPVTTMRESSVEFSGLTITVYNGANVTENVTFYLASRNPDQLGTIPGFTLNGAPPKSYSNYTLPFPLPYVTNNTNIFILAFDNSSTVAEKLQIDVTAR